MTKVYYKGKEYRSIQTFADDTGIPYEKAYKMVWKEGLTKTGNYKPAWVKETSPKRSSAAAGIKPELEPFSCPDGAYPSREYLRYAKEERQRLIDGIPRLRGWDAVRTNKDIEFLEEQMHQIRTEGYWFSVLDRLFCGEDVSYAEPNVVHTCGIILQNPKGIYRAIYGKRQG